MKKIIYLLILSFGGFSCGKTSLDCFSDPGEISSEVRKIDSSFTHLNLFDNIDVELVSSNRNFVEVIAGKNLLDAISTEYTIDTVIIEPVAPDTTVRKDIQKILSIRNNSACSFLRNDERPTKVIVFYTALKGITYRSNGNLKTLGELKTDTLKVDIFEGSGSLDLNINTYISYLNYHFGTADLHVDGKSNVNYIYQVSYGPIDAARLITGYTYLESRSANSCYIHADIALGATINGPGNIYYTGSPEISLIGTGSGKLINNN